MRDLERDEKKCFDSAERRCCAVEIDICCRTYRFHFVNCPSHTDRWWKYRAEWRLNSASATRCQHDFLHSHRSHREHHLFAKISTYTKAGDFFCNLKISMWNYVNLSRRLVVARSYTVGSVTSQVGKFLSFSPSHDEMCGWSVCWSKAHDFMWNSVYFSWKIISTC